MGTRKGKPALLGGVMLVVIWLAACSSAADPGSPAAAAASGSHAAAAAAASPAATPRLVKPKPAGGSPGKGPLVISNPAPLPAGQIGSQKVVLSDRTLVIKSVTTQRGKNQGSVLIDLDLVVRNTGGQPIRNESTFFRLIGLEGDTFSQQDNSYAFYGSIAAHTSRSGTIGFEIPAAAASSLYLLYRPEIATETVLTRLKVG
jgi:Domain of unknown function (DUF4352)